VIEYKDSEEMRDCLKWWDSLSYPVKMSVVNRFGYQFFTDIEVHEILKNIYRPALEESVRLGNKVPT